jgi:predicted enzyme related to lactoylglutathione lyase
MPQKVTGLGGVFVKCDNPDATREWYVKHLGFSPEKWGTTFEWRNESNPEQKGCSVWNAFPKETKYFDPSTRDVMINLIVEDLEWLLGELKNEGIEPVKPMEASEYGKFAHIMDPDGIKIELWEPVAE